MKKEGQLGVGELEAGRKIEVWRAGGGSSSRGIEQGIIVGGGNFTCNCRDNKRKCKIVVALNRNHICRTSY